MTGGQMAPTTLEGMPTATCPYGRNIALNGYPLKIGDLLAQLEGTCLVTRQKANKWMEANMFPFYPLGDLKNVE